MRDRKDDLEFTENSHFFQVYFNIYAERSKGIQRPHVQISQFCKYLEVQKRFYVNFMIVPMDNSAEWFYNGHDNDRMGTF